MMQDICFTPGSINDLEYTFDQKQAESNARAYLEQAEVRLAVV